MSARSMNVIAVTAIVTAVSSTTNAALLIPENTWLNTEMVSMNLTGNTPMGMLTVTESATNNSTGQTRVSDSGGGLYHIESFFDVWTELSLDTNPGMPGPEIVLPANGRVDLDDDGMLPYTGHTWAPGPGELPLPPVGGTYFGHPIVPDPNFFMTFAWHTVTGPGTYELLPDGITLLETFPSLLTFGLDLNGDQITDFTGTAEGPTSVWVFIPTPGSTSIVAIAVAALFPRSRRPRVTAA